MSHHTVFGDLRQRALAVYRVRTQGSAYLVGFHELRGRKFVIVRGEPGTDREHVVVRDSDPRVGEHSMFDLPIDQWPGHVLEVATMTSSTIESVVAESDPVAVAAVGADGQLQRSPWSRPTGAATSQPFVALPPPPGMSETPRIVPVAGRGTKPLEIDSKHVARQVLLGQPPPAADPEVPYPERHVRYAESVVLLLRSIARREQLYGDIADNRAMLARLREALDTSVTLLEQIRRRDRK